MKILTEAMKAKEFLLIFQQKIIASQEQ